MNTTTIPSDTDRPRTTTCVATAAALAFSTLLAVAAAPTTADAQTTFVCSDLPLENCHSPRTALLRVSDRHNPNKHRLVYKWLGGGTTPHADVGDPRDDTAYAICIYDQVAATPSLATEIFIPAGLEWDDPIRVPGYRFDDIIAEYGGVYAGRVKPGGPGRNKVVFRALGEDVPVPVAASPTALFFQDPAVVGQVQNSEGFCWSSNFTGGRNRARRFRASGIQ